MGSLALQHDAFAPQRPPGMRAGLVLAVIAHLLLVAALAWSVRWNASEPEGVVAELWAATPQIAAQRIAAPELPPAPRVEPKPLQPAPRVVEPPRDARADAQIAIERAAAAKARRMEEERQESARQAELAKRQAKKDEALLAEAARREQAQRADDAKRRQQAADAQEKKKAEDQTRLDEKKLATLREANLKRAMNQAGSSDEASTSTTGSAARSAGPSAGYAGRIKARIKPNIVLTSSIAGNLLATVEVRCAPDGTIVGRKLTQSSGSTDWDNAVLRAIDKTEVLPRDTDGRVPSSFSIDFKPSE